MTAETTAPRSGVVKTGAMATLILAWEAFADMTLSLALVGSALVVQPWIVAVVTFVLYLAITLTFCAWIDRNWDGWSAKAGPRVAAKVEKWRRGRFMGRAVDWISDGSALTYGIAAALLSPQIVVTTARVVSGKAVGPARILWACLSYATAMAVVIGLLALAVRGAEHAL
jgi:hypothetical protein